MKFQLRILFLLLLLSAPSLRAETLTIGVEDIPYLPYYETKNGEFRGLIRELLEHFGNDEKLDLKFLPLPIKRLYSSLIDTKSIDFKFPDNDNWGKSQKKGSKLYYSKGILSFTDGVMVLPKHKNKGKEALKVLGTVRGFSPWPFMAEVKNNKILLQENNSLIGVLKQALNSRVDGVFINIDVAKYHLREELKKPGGLVFDDSLSFTKDVYKISTLSHPQMIVKFNSWLERNEPLRQALLKKWQLSD